MLHITRYLSRTSRKSLTSTLPSLACPINIYSSRQISNTQDEVLRKYQDKLAKKAERLGVKTVDELKEKLKDEIEQQKKKFASIDVLKELETHTSKATNPNIIKISKPLTPTDKTEKPPFKTLSSFIDVEKIKALEPEQISLIWRARFQSNPQNICSTVPVDIFTRLYKTARENPNFILPLKKENQGHELHFVQWSFTGPNTTHVIFTTLAEYKLHGEYSKPHTTLTFHKELSDKGLVLMNGVVEEDSNILLSEAQLLILNLQNFYGGLHTSDEAKYKLLRGFNTGSDDFSLEKLIEHSKDVEA